MSIMRRNTLIFASVLVMLLLLTACGRSAATPQIAAPTNKEVEDKVEAPAKQEAKATEAPKEEVPIAELPHQVEAPKEEEAKADMPASKVESSEGYASGGEAPAEVDGDVVIERSADDSAKPRATPIRERDQQATPLKAGEVNDNDAWDDYLLYRRQYRGPAVHDLDITERYIIEAQDNQGNPLLDAQVQILVNDQQQQQREVYTARTYATGQILFHPLALGLTDADQFVVRVTKAGLSKEFTLTRFNAQASNAFTEKWQVKLDPPKTAKTINLDLVFLIDATGSMDDEIAKIQTTIYEVTARLDALPGRPNIRYGLVSYRDRGDEFVTHKYDFTPEVQQFAQNLDMVAAGGGGDYPESLNEGLHQAIENLEWREADTVKLIFLVADAPPHLDYQQDYDYAQDVVTAAERGIKIFPLASSGLDDQGEYIFRQLAQFTQGRFIFMTYATESNGGAPGETTTHHVDDYSVENLDDLLVKLVTSELAYQTPRLTQ